MKSYYWQREDPRVGSNSLFSTLPIVASTITMAKLLFTGPSNNQTNPSMVAAVILDDPRATIVTPFNPLDSCLSPVATSNEIAQ
ncbi:hypothetical protein GH714_000222 [Hevea brasiliensis]|uniref:Uncharacterized protein n=1 Tax=Hevea brasiliensis TaxID=3981 RepID=A0A6A6L8Z2_HEVBR|nr:hypothetical protein GH714_000222 [Hevea brasiliensis]